MLDYASVHLKEQTACKTVHSNPLSNISKKYIIIILQKFELYQVNSAKVGDFLQLKCCTSGNCCVLLTEKRKEGKGPCLDSANTGLFNLSLIFSITFSFYLFEYQGVVVVFFFTFLCNFQFSILDSF